MYREVLLVKYGEIALRGGNRRIYEDMLLNAIRRNLVATHPGEFAAYKEQGRFVIRRREAANNQPLGAIIPQVACIFGISSVTTAIRIEERGMDAIMAAS
ncbi:MAG: hypothetical protein LBE35_11450, partial [Clostridiales bacterium]|nr:hypothetical protein [Clostridiales bacterium]